MRLRLIAVLGAVLALNAQDQPTGRGVNFYSIEKEVALGKQLAADFQQTHAPLDNAAARDYIEQMGARLEQTLHQPSPFTYHFELTTDFSGTFLEPAAFPGGFVFVPAGLILAANDEAELAGTLAHAMAHIAARHRARQATKAQIAQQATIPLATIPLIFWGGWNGYGSLSPSQDSPVLLPVGMLQFQKAMESEADRLAVRMTAAAGYDPEGLARYVGRVQDPPQRSSSLFFAFPPREQRMQAIEQMIQALPAKGYASGDFARIQEEVRRALPPPAPKPPARRSRRYSARGPYWKCRAGSQGGRVMALTRRQTGSISTFPAKSTLAGIPPTDDRKSAIVDDIRQDSSEVPPARVLG